MNDRVKEVLQVIVERFKSGDIPEAVALASYPIADIPSSRWSFTNRILMVLAGTGDARGFRQWKEVHRWVRKGAQAIYILVPCLGKKVDEDTGEEQEIVRYFKPSPVFMYEDTEGKPLEYEQIALPELPLIHRAHEWGICVKAVPGNYLYRGSYAPQQQEILMATPEEKTFFHELAHAGHERVKGTLTGGQDPMQEIVAELCAQALCRLVGKQARDTMGNSYRYIAEYAGKIGLSPYSACLKVLGDTGKVLNCILGLPNSAN